MDTKTCEKTEHVFVHGRNEIQPPLFHSSEESYMQFLSLINAPNTPCKNTHRHKDILRALMFIKQPAEMKPIRLCSHEKHCQRGDRTIHAESRINIKAPRQALFPVSSFLPGQNKLQRRRRSDVLYTVLVLTFPQGKIGFSKSFTAREIIADFLYHGKTSGVRTGKRMKASWLALLFSGPESCFPAL